LPQGAAANLVETEQLVVLDGGAVLASYVQLRGSIPLVWTQIPNIKYKPPTKLLEGAGSAAAFDAHVEALLDKYKARGGGGAVGGANLLLSAPAFNATRATPMGWGRAPSAAWAAEDACRAGAA
jgi:hypothetical protein